MVLLLTVLSGVAWTIVYIDSIRVGFKPKTYAMPIAALGMNIAWEWTYAVRDLTHGPVPTEKAVHVVAVDVAAKRG